MRAKNSNSSGDEPIAPGTAVFAKAHGGGGVSAEPLHRRLFGLDRRSIAMWRVGMAVTCLYDLFHRSHHLSQFYTDDGVHPRFMALQYFSSPYWWSIHFTNGSFAWMVSVFLVHSLILILLGIGYRTRLMHVLAYFMCISLQTRNELVLHSGDVYMRVMLFFGMWLPSSDCYSVDLALSPSAESNTASTANGVATSKSRQTWRALACDWSTIAVIGQIAILYVSSCFHKSGREWTTDFTATWYALQLDFFCKPFGTFLLSLPDWVLQVLTFAVWNWEYYSPVLYFIPVYFDFARSFAAFGTMMLHFGFGLGLRLAMFTYITMLSQLVMFSSGFWDVLVLPLLRYRSAFVRTRIAYSARKPIYRILARSAAMLCCLPEVAVTAMDDGDDDAGDDSEGLARVPRGRGGPAFTVRAAGRGEVTGVDALLAFCDASPLLFGWAVALKSGFARRAVDVLLLAPARLIDRLFCWEYRGAPQRRRGAVQRRTDPTTATYDVLEVAVFLARNAIAGVTIVCVAWWVYSTLNQVPPVPDTVWRYMVSTQLAQEWSMFSPHPPNTGFYFVIAANLSDDSQVDLFAERGLFRFHGAPLTWKMEPKYEFAASIGNHRTFKYFEAYLWGQGYDDIDVIRLYFGRWICREWNSKHSGPKLLWYFEWHMISHTLDHVSKKREQYADEIVWQHYCYDSKPWTKPQPAVAAQ